MTQKPLFNQLEQGAVAELVLDQVQNWFNFRALQELVCIYSLRTTIESKIQNI